MWRDGVETRLADLGGGSSSADDINDSGLIVGDARRPDGSSTPVVWRDGAIEILDAPVGVSPAATAINNFGQIVGSSWSALDEQRAVLWDNGQFYFLDELLDPEVLAEGWTLSMAWDINDRGWIVGYGYNRLTLEKRGFLLRAQSNQEVPEPAMTLLTLAALAACAGVRRRSGRPNRLS